MAMVKPLLSLVSLVVGAVAGAGIWAGMDTPGSSSVSGVFTREPEEKILARKLRCASAGAASATAEVLKARLRAFLAAISSSVALQAWLATWGLPRSITATSDVGVSQLGRAAAQPQHGLGGSEWDISFAHRP